MRRNQVRRLRALPGGAARRESDSDRVARITRELVEEAGGEAVSLLKLIERRAPTISAGESAAFILQEWRKGGTDRDRLRAMAAKDPADLEAERALTKEIHAVLKSVTGGPWETGAERVHAKVAEFLRVQQMRGRIPSIITLTELGRAAREAVTMTDTRLAIRMDPLLRLFSRAAL